MEINYLTEMEGQLETDFSYNNEWIDVKNLHFLGI